MAVTQSAPTIESSNGLEQPEETERALAPPLSQRPKTPTGSTKLSLGHLQTAESLQLSTRYRTKQCDPAHLDSVCTSSNSGRGLLNKNAATSNDLDLETAGNSLLSLEDLIPKFRMQEFELIFSDARPSEKFGWIIPTDCSTSPAELKRHIFGDFRNYFLNLIDTDTTKHGVPPNTQGLLSLFLPKYPPEESSSTDSEPSKPKEWELGFHVGLLTLSLRDPSSFNNIPLVLRYTAKKDEEAFDLCRDDNEKRKQIAFFKISDLINPELRVGNAMMSQFEKVAADFFGGKEVLTDGQYASKPPPSFARTQTYLITYNGSREADKVFDACKQEPKLFQLLSDCLWSNDLHCLNSKKEMADWAGGASITLFTTDSNGESIDIDEEKKRGDLRDIIALVTDIRNRKRSRQAEGEVNQDRGSDESKDDSDYDNLTPEQESAPRTNIEHVNISQNDNEKRLVTDQNLNSASIKHNDDVGGTMSTRHQQYQKKSSYSQKKKKRSNRRGKGNKKEAPNGNSMTESKLDRNIPVKPAGLATQIVSAHLGDFNDDSSPEKSEEWNVVGTKLPLKTGHGSNASADTSSSPMIETSVVQPRSPAAHLCNKGGEPLPIASSKRPYAHTAINKAAAATGTLRQPLIEPADFTQVQLEEVREGHDFRVFENDEYPALSAQVSNNNTALLSASKVAIPTTPPKVSVQQKPSSLHKMSYRQSKDDSADQYLDASGTASGMGLEVRFSQTIGSGSWSQRLPDTEYFVASLNGVDSDEPQEPLSTAEADLPNSSVLLVKWPNAADEAGPMNNFLAFKNVTEGLKIPALVSQSGNLSVDLGSGSTVKTLFAPSQGQNKVQSQPNAVLTISNSGEESQEHLSNNVKSRTRSISAGNIAVIPVTYFEGGNSIAKQPARLLLTEEEAARIVITQPFMIRSARYSSTGVSLPNFYAEIGDEDSDDEEIAVIRTKKYSSLDIPSVRSSTHSHKTGAAIPNFFYVPEHDQDDQIDPSPAFDDRSDQEPTSDDESIEGAIDLNLIDSDPQYEARAFAVNENLDVELNTSSAFGSTLEAAAIGEHTLGPSSGLCGNDHAPKSAPQASPIISSNSRVDLSTRLLDSIQTQDHSGSESADSIVNSNGPPTPEVRHRCQPLESSQSHPNYVPILDAAESSYADSCLYDQSPLEPVTYPDTSSNSEAGISQDTTKRGSSDQNGQASDTAISNGTCGQIDDQSGDPGEVAIGRAVHPPLTELTALCTNCGERSTPSVEARQVFCAGCGPNTGVRYCSIACLLVDSLNHAHQCANYSATDRLAYHNLPSQYFIYILNPITPLLGYLETPERFRQRAFSMHCHSGPFPPLLRAWMKKAMYVYPTERGLDIGESSKRTGDYAIFRSSAIGAGHRNNPDCEVILTIKLHPRDPQKQMLNRVLNACYLIWDHRLVQVLYRFLRNLITDSESFSIFKYTDPVEVVWPEFTNQFRQEFGFDSSMQTVDQPFDVAQEWLFISQILINLEHQYPILFHWYR